MAKRAKTTSKLHKWVLCEPSGCLLIRFNYQKRTYRFAPVSRGRFSNPQDLAIANRVASEIEQSIKLGRFTGLEPWKPHEIESTEIGVGKLTLIDVWGGYKAHKADRVSKASQDSVWSQTDRCLKYLVSLPLIGLSIRTRSVTELTHLNAIVLAVLSRYSPPVAARVLSDLHAACNLAVKHRLITVNPLTGYKDYLPASVKSVRSKQAYSADEARIIVEAFRTESVAYYRYYADFVEFLFLTGVRPQLAIALTWADYHDHGGTGGDKLILNKGFTNGVLTDGKTGRETHYPVFPQLARLLRSIQLDGSWDLTSLIFPSPKGGHISLHNFTNRVWRPVIKELVAAGKVSQYLPTYHCRHSTATFLAKAGLPTATIAALLDTSERMLNKHYLDNQELMKVVIPDLLDT